MAASQAGNFAPSPLRIPKAAGGVTLRTRPRAIAYAVSVALFPGAVWMFPAYGGSPVAPGTVWTNVNVKTGGGQTTVGNNQTINTTTTHSVVYVDKADIGKDATVFLDQPNAGSTSLVYVTKPGQTQWDGRFRSDGNVMFTNPDGLLISRGATVSVGSLFATSLSISDQDFLAGRYQFTNTGKAGPVVNQGTINIITANGYAALAAPQVRNDGVIVARMGTVALAAGNQVTLDMVGDGLIKVRVDQAALNASAINSGTIQADGGNVLLTAHSANALLDTVVNNGGVIRANSLVQRNGEIVLDGGGAGIVANSGTIQAAGVDTGRTGGTVKILGQYVGLFGGSSVNVSGDAGGGTALVGGNFHGTGLEQNASMTYVDSNATINADAIRAGNGGQVAVWSDNGTKFFGNISARGGAQSGDGGFVEVSGRDKLTYAGLTDLRAPNGNVGTLLLDPTDITIVNDANPANTTITCTPGNCTVPAGGPFTDSGTGNLTDGTLNAQLLLSSVDVNATNDIVVQSAVSINTFAHTLNLNSAAGGINLDGTFAGGGTLGINFKTTLTLGATLNVSGVTANADGGTTGTISGTGLTYVLDNATADKGTVAVGGGGTVNWSNTPNISDATGAVNFQASGSMSGNITADTLNFTTYTTSGLTLDITANTVTGVGGTITVNKVDANPGQTNTVGGTGATYTLDNATQDKGTGNGYTWTHFQNINDSTGTVDFQVSGSQAGNVTAATLNYSTYGSNVTFDLANNSGATTGISGTWGSVTQVDANSAKSNTITGSGTTYLLADGSPDAGSGSGVSWTNFQNINDATGTVNFNATGSISNNVTAQALNYSSWTTSAVTFDIGATTSTGIGGTWTGVTSVTGKASNAATNTIQGGVNYTLTNATPNAGTDSVVSWTNFGTLSASGTVNFQASGSVAGDISAATLNYSTYGSNVTFDLAAGANQTTGIGGTWSSVTQVDANAAKVNTIKGSGETYSLTDGTPNAGDNGTVTWTAFRNINDATGTVNFNTSGSVTGSVTAATLDYSSYGVDVTFALANGSGATTGIGTTWSGVTQVTGNATNSNTITGSGQTYTLTDGTPDAGTNGTVAWTDFKNITDATGTVNFQVSGSLTGDLTAKTLDFSTYGSAITLDISAASITPNGVGGTITGVDTVFANPANSNTVQGSGQTYTLTNATPDAGTGGGYTWTAFQNINDATGTVNFNATGSISNNVTAQALNYSSWTTSAVTFDIGATTSTGIGGTWTGVTSVTGKASNAATNTIANSNGTYNLTGSNAGNDGTVFWTNFGALTDSGAGTLVMHSGANGSLAGNVNLGGTGTIDYTGYTGAITFELAGTANQTTGITGTWTGVTTATGSATTTTNTIKGANKTYTLSALDAGSDGVVSWTNFGKLSDTGTGTVSAADATYVMNGANTGTVTGLLSSTFTGIGNITDTGTGSGVLNMHGTGNGTLSGNVDMAGGAIDYTGYTTAITFELAGTANQSTGITGTWANIATATGATASTSTIKSANDTYNLTALNVGDNGVVSWTKFGKISDTGTGTINATNQTYALTGANQGTAAGVLASTFTGIGNITDAGTGTLNMHSGANGSLSGNVDMGGTGTISYTGYTGNVTFELAGTANQSTGITGTWTGVTNVTGNAAGTSTIKGASATYTLNGANTGSDGVVTWTTFGNITDTGTGTLNMHGTANGSLAGNVNMGGTGTIDYTGYTGAITFELAGTANQTTGITGTWTGVTTATGSATTTTNTIKGANKTYTLSALDAGSDGTVSWTSFGKLNDTGTGTVSAANGTYTLNGANTGTSTLLSSTFTGIGNITDTGTGTLNMHGTGNGTLSGNANMGGTGTISYAGYSSAVTYSLSGSGSTGITGTVSGVTNVTGSSNSDTMSGTGQTFTITGAGAGNNGTVFWTSFENLSGGGASTLQATSATWTLTGANAGSATGITGFTGMANLADLGTGIFNLNAGTLSGNLNGGGTGTLNYTSRTGPVTFNLAGTGTGVTGSISGITTVNGSAASDTITGASANWTLNGPNAGNANGISWTSFENVVNTTAGATFTLTGGSLTSITSPGATTFTSNTNVTVKALIGGTLNITGSASQWILNNSSSVNGSTSLASGITPNGTTASPDVYFNGPSINGPTGGAIGGVIASVGGTIAQIAARALDEAFDTDSVAKQINDGFVGDVGTTPPMDHRIDDTGISVPECFNESREGQGDCK